LKPYQRRT